MKLTAAALNKLARKTLELEGDPTTVSGRISVVARRVLVLARRVFAVMFKL